MAFIPAPNTVKACLIADWGGVQVEICLYFLKSSTVTEADMDTLFAALDDWRIDNLFGNVSADLVATHWYLVNLTTATSLSKIYPIVTSAAGQGTSPSVQNNVALTTTFQTGLRGRSYRGRAYTPGLPQDFMFSSVSVDAATAAAITADYAAIASAIPAGWQHVVVSNQNNGVLRSTAARTPVTGYRTEAYTDSQRRRLHGRGS